MPDRPPANHNSGRRRMFTPHAQDDQVEGVFRQPQGLPHAIDLPLDMRVYKPWVYPACGIDLLWSVSIWTESCLPRMRGIAFRLVPISSVYPHEGSTSSSTPINLFRLVYPACGIDPSALYVPYWKFTHMRGDRPGFFLPWESVWLPHAGIDYRCSLEEAKRFTHARGSTMTLSLL